MSLSENDINSFEKEHLDMPDSFGADKFDVLHYGALADLKLRR